MMPKINVYLPDELAAELKHHDLPVSSICQTALQRALEKVQAAKKSGQFDRFGDSARAAIVAAEGQARDLQHNFLGTEHLLLGLLACDGRSSRTLKTLGFTLEACREEVEELVPRGKRPAGGRLSFTPRSKTVLDMSLREALKLGDERVREEHLLLALLAEGEGVAAQVLAARGITYGMVLPRVTTEVVVDGSIEQVEVGLTGLVDMRIQQLREELTEEFKRLRERFERERERTEKLRELLATKGDIEPVSEPTGKAKKKDRLKCSFCSKIQADVEKLIAGPGVYICNECIDLCNEIIEEETQPPGPSV